MMNKVTSADGTTIAYERFGTGAPVILVSGALCDRESLRPLARELSSAFEVLSFDRRGRGDSGDNPAFGVERGIEDLAALVTAVGGTSAVYGHSSGAGLALQAAAHGLPFNRIVLHEPPYGQEDGREGARALDTHLRRFLADDRPDQALELFLSSAGMPAEDVAAMCMDPQVVRIAATLAYDFEVMGLASLGGVVPDDLVDRITAPTLVLAGGASPAFMVEAARRIGARLSAGTREVLPGEQHVVAPEVLAPLLTAFLSDAGVR